MKPWIIIGLGLLVSLGVWRYHGISHDITPVTIVLDGQIVSVVHQTDKFAKFRFQSKHYLTQLSWYRHQPENLTPGQVWRLKIKIKPPRGVKNPGGFDYGRYLRLQGVNSAGYVISGELITDNPWAKLMTRLRQKLLTRTNNGVVQGLVLGVRHNMSADQREMLARTGTSHLLAISGLHIGLMAGLGYWLGQGIWCRFYRLCLRIPAPIIGAVSALVLAWVYSALAGFTLPTQRALIMVSVFMLSIILRIGPTIWQAYFTAVGLTLIWDPLAILSASFWLSYLAVAWLIYGGFREMIKTQVLIFFGLMPLNIFYFNQVPLLAGIINLLAIPYMSFILLPVSIISLILGDNVILYCSLKGFWWVLEQFSSLDKFIWVISLPQWVLGVMLLCVALSLQKTWRYPGILGFIVCLNWPGPNPKLGEFTLVQLDVGQGLATLIQTHHHSLIFDTGPNPSGQIVRANLRKLGIKYPDKLILSHDDFDHAAGAVQLSQVYKINPEHCQAGQYWSWDGVLFQILHPSSTPHGRYKNKDSCVLKITGKHKSALLTGDIPRQVERQLVQAGLDLSADILIVPHHGSKTSSSAAFIDAVNPQLAIISSGYLNRFRLPSKSVLRRYKNRKIKILDTAKVGGIEIKDRVSS